MPHILLFRVSNSAILRRRSLSTKAPISFRITFPIGLPLAIADDTAIWRSKDDCSSDDRFTRIRFVRHHFALPGGSLIRKNVVMHPFAPCFWSFLRTVLIDPFPECGFDSGKINIKLCHFFTASLQPHLDWAIKEAPNWGRVHGSQSPHLRRHAIAPC